MKLSGQIASAVLLAGLLALPSGGPALAQKQPQNPAPNAQAPNPSFTLVNRASQPIRAFYATPAGRTNWGQSRVGPALAAGTQLALRVPADGNCLFDMRAVYADGRTEERRGVNTCETKDVVFGEAARSFQLDNRGTAPIVKLEARKAGAAAWQANKMAAGAIAPGARQEFQLPPGEGCVFDLRVTFADGRAREKHAADLCRMPAQAVD